MGDKKQQQASREFGIKLAKALRQRAGEAAKENGLDSRFVMLGAADYLKETAEFQLDPPIDPSQADFRDRSN